MMVKSSARPGAVLAEEVMAKKESLGERIKRLMNARGLNQTSLAQRAGIERTEVNRIINGRRAPREHEVAYLCTVLQVPLDELFDGIEAPEQFRESFARVETAAKRVLAAESARDESEAQREAALKVFETERAAWDAERCGLRAEIEQLTVERDEARRAAQEPERTILQSRIEELTAELEAARKVAHEVDRQRASMEHALRAEQASSRADRAKLLADRQQLDAACRQLQAQYQQVEAGNRALRSHVANLQQQLTEQEGKTVFAGLLGALGGTLLGGAIGAGAEKPPPHLRSRR